LRARHWLHDMAMASRSSIQGLPRRESHAPPQTCSICGALPMPSRRRILIAEKCPWPPGRPRPGPHRCNIGAWHRQSALQPRAAGARHTDETSTQTEETTMSKHDEARRAFLVGAAVTGAAARAALVPEAYAKDDPRRNAQKNGAAEHAHASARGHGAFFNDADSLTIEAFTEQLMPGAPGKPGAKDAGVLNYIDLALAGAYQDQQDF